MTEITEEMKKKYLEVNGVLCPFCGSSDIRADSLESDGNEAWNNVHCEDCKEEWKDIYKLVDIIQVE